jgi:hypothetical protein
MGRASPLKRNNVRLHGLQVRRGTTVEVRADPNSPTWQVVKIVGDDAHLCRRDSSGMVVVETKRVDDLVAVREFGQPIYPGLHSVGRIERGGDKPFHTVINAEDYHALEMLLYISKNSRASSRGSDIGVATATTSGVLSVPLPSAIGKTLPSVDAKNGPGSPLRAQPMM